MRLANRADRRRLDGPPSRRTAFILAALLVLVSVFFRCGADAYASVCDSLKLKASGQMAASHYACHAKATKTGAAADGACLMRAIDKFDTSFAKAESRGECAALGDATGTRATLQQYVDSVVSALRPMSTANRCASTKLAAAGRDAKSTFMCQARRFKRTGVSGADCDAVPRAKLLAQFQNAERKPVPCLTTGDGAPIADSIAELVRCVIDPSLAGCASDDIGDGGRWGGLVTLRSQNLFVTPVHAILLSDSRILFFGYAKSDRLNGNTTTQSYVSFLTAVPSDPGQGAASELQVVAVAEAPRAANESVWCAGHAPDEGGRIFTAGGTRFDTGLVPRDGLAYTQILNVATGTWNRLAGDPTMKGGARWYPTVTKLPPATRGGATPMLITAGLYTVNENDPNRSVEVFDPQLGDYRLLASAVESPHGIAPKDYTHVFLMPVRDGGGFPRDEVLMFGRYGDMYGFNYSDPVPSGGARFTARIARPNDRTVGGRGADGASTVMLGDGRMLIAGGANSAAPSVQQDLLRAVDIYDPQTNAWSARIDTGHEREDAATVLLPDGRVLVINGTQKTASAPDPIPQTVDPTLDPPSIVDGPPMPSDPFPNGGDNRGYHNIALLLPDASVLIGGGRDNSKRGPGHWERPDIRFFYPYPDRVRPVIGTLPSDVMSYGDPFDVPYSGGPVARATLVALGSMTHDVDMNQRHVELTIASVSSTVVRVLGPSTPLVAPPGNYMLFVFDSAGMPSTARIIRVS